MMTNYERIKNMSVEQMVNFLDENVARCFCIYSQDGDCIGMKCTEGIKQWLNQEVEE